MSPHWPTTCELLALIDLCEHHAATAEEWQALEALVERLPEALDTGPMRRARVLIERGKTA